MLRVLYGLIVLLGTVFGVTLAFNIDPHILTDVPGFADYSDPRILLAILLGGLGYLIMATVSHELEKWIERNLPSLKVADLLWGAVGLISGLVVAILFLVPLYLFVSAEPVRSVLLGNPLLNSMAVVVPPFLMIFFGYLGMMLFLRKQSDFGQLLTMSVPIGGPTRILDTSVIIDGRVIDLVRTGLLTGSLVVPQFVLDELHQLSDAAGSDKKRKGDRGFAIVERLKHLDGVRLVVSPDTYPRLEHVDAKLLEMAKDTGGTMLTNDTHLYKLARLQGVVAINIQEVANALRPPVIQGDELELAIVKKGKDARQGVAYMNDGTMVVIEDGAGLVGTDQTVKVDNILQTAVGRMIFAHVTSSSERSAAPARQEGAAPFTPGGRETDR